MQVLVYDFRWTSPEHFEFQASKDNRFGTKSLQIGSELSVAVKGGVRCAGSVRDGVFKPCLHQVTGKRKCDACRNREGNFVITSFDGFDTGSFTAEDLERLEGEHLVYLALFNKDLVKVGVSREDRKTLRQIEQGSHHTLYIAKTPDGILARQIETLFRQNGVMDKIPASSKKDFLCPDITPKEGRDILMSLFRSKKDCLKSHPHLMDFLLDNPEFVDWGKVYNLEEVVRSAKGFHSVQLKEDEWVSGRILSAKGPFLILETPDELVSLCSKDLIGREVEFIPRPAGLKLNKAFQSSLF